MMRLLLSIIFAAAFTFCFCQPAATIKKKDRRRDVELVTTAGSVIIRLSAATPVHRDNFIALVKTGFYDSLLFHRVIKNFMIQSGDPNSNRALAGQPLGSGGSASTLPAEFSATLFHKRGALGAAREGDAKNPERRSSSSQFYIVQGKTFTDAELDSIEIARLAGRKISADRRLYYKTIGGTPQLDSNYTVFGQVVKGMEVVDEIAGVPTGAGKDKDRPLQDVRILAARLIRQKKY